MADMNLDTLPADTIAILTDWHRSQIELPKVLRWSKYIRRNPNLRIHSTEAHSLSISQLGSKLIGLLESTHKVRLDLGLLLTTFLVHDLGEGVLNCDTLFIDKTDQKDVEEWLAFERAYSGGINWAAWRRAFLLQFCLKDIDLFPESVRKEMWSLRRRKKKEALVFCAIETFDYILYALECFRDHGDIVIATHVLRNQPPRLDTFAQEIPFIKSFWTSELQEWCLAFVCEHRDIPAEETMQM